MRMFPGQEEPADAPVLQAVTQDTSGGISIAARPSRLLIVTVEGIRKIPVNDPADVRRVHAQAEGAGRDHDRHLSRHELPLCLLTLGCLELPMVTDSPY